VLEEKVLSKERITIGRRPHNDLVINNSTISAEHAVIVTMLGDAYLEDLDSTNGTRVNGQAIKKHFLKNNDVIELAKYRLRFVNEALHKNDGSVFIRTQQGAIKPSAHREVKVAAEQAADHEIGNTEVLFGSGTQSRAIIRTLSGENAGGEIVLVKPLTTIGLRGKQVAVVTSRADSYSLTHVEGDNYPIVNGKNIGPSAYLLESGDRIELAGVEMEFLQL
jgi:pSer/pThr/pTyr-binding forkhead associated (FHA) protein